MNHNHLPIVSVMIPGDLHLTEPGLPNSQTAQWVMDQANELIHPNFVQFIGDNVQDARPDQFALFRRLADQLQSPWYALVGDHDVDAARSIDEFQSSIGRPWGSLRHDGFRFLRLTTQEAQPVGMSDGQLEWLRQELTAANRLGERVVLFQHNYAYQIWEEFAGPGIDEWRILTQAARIEALICGHTHYWQIANDGRNVHIATRSIGDPEGGPAGYLLACFQGSRLGLTYRTAEDHGPVVVVLSPRASVLCTKSDHVTCGETEVVARIWSDRALAKVEACLDDSRPFPLQDDSRGNWSARFDAAGLSKGIHQVRVRATCSEGGVGEQSVEFPVDPTGRYTAIPCAIPPVSSTNFC